MNYTNILQVLSKKTITNYLLYKEFLKEFGIDYDERYIFKPVEY